MANALALRLAHFAELIRFYQSSIINTAFGYGLFAVLIKLGLNIFAAQLVAHVIGTMFNYVTHSRHSFRMSEPAKIRFAVAYIVFYLLSVGLLALFALLVRNPYVAGVTASIVASLINFFVLRYAVFRQKTVL